jgi:phosphate transport system permease protein
MAVSEARSVKDAPETKSAKASGRKTRRSVIVIDRAIDWIITVGGIGVIVAVFGIMAFLVEVVVPLFTGGSAGARIENATSAANGNVLMSRVDEYKTLFVTVTDRGAVRALHVPTGTPVFEGRFDFGDAAATAFGATFARDQVAFGFADGTVRFGKVDLRVEVVTPDKVPAAARRLDRRDRADAGSVYSTLDPHQVRKLSVAIDLGGPQPIAGSKGIRALDFRAGGTVERPTRTFATVDVDGVIRLSRSETRVNLLTGATTTRVATSALPDLPRDINLVKVLITEHADQVYVADANGTIYRFDTRDFAAPKLAEVVDLVPAQLRLTAVGFLIGEQSLVVGGSDGRVEVYFRLQQPDAKTSDGYALVKAHTLEPHTNAVVAFDKSARTKSFATADAAGNVWLRHATSDQTLLKLKRPDAAAGVIEAMAIAPRDDGILVATADDRYTLWDISVPHPETTWGAIFAKKWYEGYPETAFTWQSSSGTDSFEPKFSLVPLIFGTVKATVYAMLFAVPIALLAAIYTSEFVARGTRAIVKPAMEMMASLPSVVLGFIAALILAPIVETWIAAVVWAFVVIPAGLLAGALIWQAVPRSTVFALGEAPKLAIMAATVLLTVYVAAATAPAFEALFFGGDFKAWANGDIGSDAPFLMLIVFPAVFVLALRAFDSWGAVTYRDATGRLPRAQAGVVDAVRWIAAVAAALAASYVLATAMIAIGLGPRGGIVDTYVQRNTLIVGFAMGFAVIPIIYTIAEDALNAVPEHLRAASLACGATSWQTATTVILPAAASGVFAAIMIGMGRAVGETMIVVMAAGNTPVIEWNVFSGLRALSANIAVELPEAVKDSTLYRMLFLAALALFVMTFIVNTGAEIIRQRFRKRAAQL